MKKLTAYQRAELWGRVNVAAHRILEQSKNKQDLAAVLDRYEHLGGLLEQLKVDNKQPVIRAEVHSDDHVFEVNFDALPWFKQATDEEILELAAVDWGGDYISDAVAQHCYQHDSEVEGVLEYVERTSQMGFECHVEAADAIKWLEINKPHLYTKLYTKLTTDE